ncbi:MAG: hypothetical protein IH975_01080 [Nitrospinae bacterium]|nr:hypothetical protein [Nitrospinota bacterium]
MKLIIEKYLTPSWKSKRRGKMDNARLVAETDEERRRLEEIREVQYHPIQTHRESPHSDWDRDIQDLKNVGRAIDPHLKIIENKIKL